MPETDRQSVESFLSNYKAAAKQSFRLARHRPKNMATLKQLGMHERECANQILSLTVEDYCKGPEDDRDKGKGGEFWFFGKRIEAHEVYIKLKLVEIGEKKEALCISFHIAEYKMSYPFK